MYNAAKEALQSYQHCILIGTDAPALDVSINTSDQIGNLRVDIAGQSLLNVQVQSNTQNLMTEAMNMN